MFDVFELKPFYLNAEDPFQQTLAHILLHYH